MLLATISGALAISVDSDDNLFVGRGETIKGMFVIENYNDKVELTPSTPWITIGGTTRIVDDNYAVEYIVSIPEGTDINVYREHIKVSDGSETIIFNVKISVQNTLFKNLFSTFSNPANIWFILLFISLILCVILYFMYRGVR